MSTSGRAGAPALHAVEPPQSESLRKLKRGEMSLDEYLDERVEIALAHIRGRVPADKLESIRVVLREKLQYDPVLVDMVHRTTGLRPRSVREH
ncbi:MAG TPA: hypothetical protein VKP30_04670 [Polyangiaceae bacterium]|nr:hypothetical protein [Polyangiaceae bacterium]